MEEIQLTREQVTRLANDDRAYVEIDARDPNVDVVANTFGYDEAVNDGLSAIWSGKEIWQALLDGSRDDIYWSGYDISVTLSDEVDRARAEGFAAGLFVGMCAVVNDGTDHRDEWAEFYQREQALDGGEIVRELEDAKTAEECVEKINKEYDDGASHVSRGGPDEKNPYIAGWVSESAIPDGWTAYGDGLGGAYLVKE